MSPPSKGMACPICNRWMIELPSWQQGWQYFKHSVRGRKDEIVIVGPEMIDLFGTLDEAIVNACDALHFDGD